MTQNDSLSRKIALRMCEEAYSPNTTSCQSDFDVEQAEQIISSELAEIAAAFNEVMESERLKSGLTPAQFKQVWARQLAALSGLGVK